MIGNWHLTPSLSSASVMPSISFQPPEVFRRMRWLSVCFFANMHIDRFPLNFSPYGIF
jgi:hypothetical protein